MIKPLNDNVLIKKEEVENKTASGIILSSTPKTEYNVGIVVAVGEGKMVDGKREPMTVKVDDKVIFEKYATTEVEFEDEKYYVISESKILAIVE